MLICSLWILSLNRRMCGLVDYISDLAIFLILLYKVTQFKIVVFSNQIVRNEGFFKFVFVCVCVCAICMHACM